MKNIEFIEKIKNYKTPSGLSTFLNPYSFSIAKNYQSIFNEFDNIYVDGYLLAEYLLLYNKVVGRFSFDFSSIADKVFRWAETHDKSIYVVGSTEKDIMNFVKIIENEYKCLRVVGYRNGYFNNSNEKHAFLKQVRLQSPDIVICGMGVVLQEKFLIDLKRSGWDGIGFTCGGFIHQTSQRGCKYYPDWVNKYNIRWLFRIYNEPKLMFRYLRYYPLYVMKIIYNKCLRKI